MGNNIYRSFHGMCWPAPCKRLNELAWTATYGVPSKNDLLCMASVLIAYQELIALPTQRCSEIIKELRKGVNDAG